MRKIENAVVAAMEKGDFTTAIDLLQTLIVRDRRRAWWALFRVAEAQSPDDHRRAMISLVGKTYLERRKGCLIGVNDSDVLPALLRLADAGERPQGGIPLAEEDWRLLNRWLPQRLSRTLPIPSNLQPDRSQHPPRGSWVHHGRFN